MYPFVPAHVPSVETACVLVGVALLFVDVVGFVEDEEEPTLDELEEAFTELELDELLEQLPPTGLHPVPQ